MAYLPQSVACFVSASRLVLGAVPPSKPSGIFPGVPNATCKCCGGESGGRRRLYGAQRHPMRPPCRTRFVQLPRGLTVLSSYLSRTFSVHYVRIGFGQRLSEPPYIDHVWSISLRFPELPRGLTVLSSMAHRTFSVHYVRIGFGQRLSEPPYIDHAWAFSLRFPLFSYIYENLFRGPIETSAVIRMDFLK